MKGAHSKLLSMGAGVRGAQALYDQDHKKAKRIYKAVEDKLKQYKDEAAAVRNLSPLDCESVGIVLIPVCRTSQVKATGGKAKKTLLLYRKYEKRSMLANLDKKLSAKSMERLTPSCSPPSHHPT